MPAPPGCPHPSKRPFRELVDRCHALSLPSLFAARQRIFLKIVERLLALRRGKRLRPIVLITLRVMIRSSGLRPRETAPCSDKQRRSCSIVPSRVAVGHCRESSRGELVILTWGRASKLARLPEGNSIQLPRASIRQARKLVATFNHAERDEYNQQPKNSRNAFANDSIGRPMMFDTLPSTHWTYGSLSS